MIYGSQAKLGDEIGLPSTTWEPERETSLIPIF